MAAPRNSASLPLDKKIFLLNNLLSGDFSLFLYGQDVDVWRSFFSFIENGLANGEVCLYAYDDSSGKVQINNIFGEAIAGGKLRTLPIFKGYIPKEIEKLDNELRKFCSKARSDRRAVRILIDFGGLITHHRFKTALDLIGNIMSKSKKNLRSLQDKKKRPLLRAAIIAFNLESLGEEEIKALAGLHKNLVVSSQDGTTTLALNFRTRRGHIELGIEVVPRDTLERFVKRHLETVVLSMLGERPMCGYDVIKTIYQRYGTSISQGTVYSLLYSLESKGLLGVEMSEFNRSKLYVLTEHGRRLAETKIKDFVAAQRYLLESIQKT